MSNVKLLKGDESRHQYTCSCEASANKNVPLILTPSRLSCILYNYVKYLKSRLVWEDDNVISQQYKEALERNIKYPEESVETVKIITSYQQYPIALSCQKKRFQIYMCHNEKNLKTKNLFVKYVELNCYKEYVDFVNQHVYNDDLEKELKLAHEVVQNMKLCNF